MRPGTGRRALAGVVAVLTWLATQGCGVLRDETPIALTTRSGPTRWHGPVADTDTVVLYTIETFDVQRRVTLRSFAPAVVPPGATVLAMRASFVGPPRQRSASGNVNSGGYPGAACVTWPPEGFGPTYDVAGLQVAPGDEVAFSAFVKFARPGDYVLDGYVLRYDDGRHRRTLRHETGEMLDLHVLAPGEKATEHVCSHVSGDGTMWTSKYQGRTAAPYPPRG